MSKVHHSFDKHQMSTCYVPSTVLRHWNFSDEKGQGRAFQAEGRAYAKVWWSWQQPGMSGHVGDTAAKAGGPGG